MVSVVVDISHYVLVELQLGGVLSYFSHHVAFFFEQIYKKVAENVYAGEDLSVVALANELLICAFENIGFRSHLLQILCFFVYLF